MSNIRFKFRDICISIFLISSILSDTTTRQNLYVHNRTLNSWRNTERSISNFFRFLPENRTEQFLLWRILHIPFKGYFSDKNISLINTGTNTNDPVFIEPEK